MNIEVINFDKLPNKQETISFLDGIYKKVKPLFNNITQKINKPVILYGAGTLGKMASNYLNKLDIPILFVIDRNPKLYENDQFWNGITICKPEEVLCNNFKEKCLLLICVVTSSYTKISNKLLCDGWKNVFPFYDVTLSYQDIHPLNNGWISSLWNKDDIDKTSYVSYRFEDDISRAHYLQFLAWHSLREEWIFKNAPISLKEKYFIPEIISILHENEIFINIGAYDGEFTNKFMQSVNYKFSTIYAFEPDHKNIDKFLVNMKSNIDKYNIHLIPKALGNNIDIEKKFKFFSGLDCLSCLNELGQDEIRVHNFNDFNIEPTIIKIHIEGKELDVFKGGLSTIRQSRPILMMTIYHNRNGMWKVPLEIMNSLNDYIYYFRLHLWCGTSGILYAIPKERL